MKSLILTSLLLCSCSLTTDPKTGQTTKAVDPIMAKGVTDAFVSVLKSPEGQVLIDAELANLVKKINPPTK